MKIKLTKYTHSFLILALGVFISSHYDSYFAGFAGGLLMGYSLKVARQSGIELKNQI